ncbi:MAG: hypothetical protein HJJLKODD_01477 [Phycisphaerae bacterium]|nr:hypothetical protein [Phycisphaerae bacterium]
MNSGWLIWLILLGLVALIWGSRHLAVSRGRRTAVRLSSTSASDWPADLPRITVLVAAKDEEANIGRCVRSLIAQDYPALQIIAINDRSSDRTAEIIDDLARRHPERFRALHVTQLREGWFGKNNAMRVGVEQADGEWFCFTDADCHFLSPRTLTTAVHYALQERVDFLCILPVLETGTFWERLLQPVCAAIMVMWFRPEKVNDPRSKAAYANGAFMLMKRELYESLGGHEAVRTELNEDMHLARLTKEAGRRLRVVENEDLYQTRMYTDFRSTWRGWSRIFLGCFGSLRRLLISTAVLSLASIFPYVSLLIGVLGWLMSGGTPWMWLTLTAAGTVAIQLSLLFRFYRLARCDVRYLPGYFLGAVVALTMLVNAMLKLNGRARTVWRGTAYRGHQLDSAPKTPISTGEIHARPER